MAENKKISQLTPAISVNPTDYTVLVDGNDSTNKRATISQILAAGTIVGTVTSVAVAGNNGLAVSGSPVTTSGTITLGLGAITPTAVTASGEVTGSNLSGTNTGDQSIQLLGDVEAGAGTGTLITTIATGMVTNAKLANMTGSSIKGRASGVGAPQDLTMTQVAAMLPAVVGDSGSGGTAGLVPAPGAGSAAAKKFLRADATWVAPDLNDLTPTQSGNAGKALFTDGTTTSWQPVSCAGTVTSVNVIGGATGLSTTGGPITASGTIALTGTVNVSHGGTGGTTADDARTNLGVTATGSDTTYAYRANNLSDLASASTARTNLGLGTAATQNTAVANGVATLDSSGKLTSAQIPDIAIVSYLGSVASQAAMLALTGQQGDWCTRSDLGTNWIITGANPALLASWTQLSYPTSPVTSVNGYTGAVTLSKSDVGLGSVENTALSTWAGSGNITAIGTLASGTVPVARVSGLGTIATQAASSVAITGGAIDGTAIGSTTPNTGAFTTLSATGGTFSGLVQANNSLAVRGNTFPSSGKGLELVVESSTVTAIQSYDRDGSLWMDAKWYAKSHDWLLSGASKMTLSSTGLAVTGAVSATSTITINNPSYIGQGILSNGADYVVKLASDANLYLDAGGGASVYQSINGTAVTQVTSTGLAVTGALTATAANTAYHDLNATSGARLQLFGGSHALFPKHAYLDADNIYFRTSAGGIVGQFLTSGFRLRAPVIEGWYDSAPSSAYQIESAASGVCKINVYNGAWTYGLASFSPTGLAVTGGISDSKGEIRLVPQNSQSAAYTLVLADAGKHILHPSADTTARTFTIPANSSVTYPIGTAITFVNQNGAGAVTIAITTDTMRLAGAGTTGSRTLAANGVATAIKITSTEWIISGTGLT